jgi:hypothetical protein
MNGATVNLGRGQCGRIARQRSGQECNAMTAMLNDVTTESYEELSNIRPYHLVAFGHCTPTVRQSLQCWACHGSGSARRSARQLVHKAVEVLRYPIASCAWTVAEYSLSVEQVSWIRRLLGDHEITSIELLDTTEARQVDLIKSAFPEAEVHLRHEMPAGGFF